MKMVKFTKILVLGEKDLSKRWKFIALSHMGENHHFPPKKQPWNSQSRIYARKNDSTERFFSSERCSPEFIAAANKSLQRARKSAVPSVRTGAVLPKMSLKKIQIAQNIFFDIIFGIYAKKWF